MTASVMQMLFDTMPLAGVRSSYPPNPQSSLTWDRVKVGDIKKKIEYRKWSAVGKVDLSTPTPAPPPEKAIWGYTADDSDPAIVTAITCRSRITDFNKYTVLDKLEWGSASPESPRDFKHQVVVRYDGVEYELPLEDKFWIASFITKDGKNQPGSHALWPHEQYHDRSLVHAFLYDLNVAGIWASVFPVSKTALAPFQAICDQLGSATALSDKTLAKDFLFTDKLWSASSPNAPSTAAVGETKTVKANLPRILVACCLTVCRENNDFFPGRVVSVGRIYPHVMVASTVPLNKITEVPDGDGKTKKVKDGITAGVRLARPAQTTFQPDPGGSSHDMAMHGMSPTIKGLLIADSNDQNELIDTRTNLPLTFWANLFNYYVTDPADDAELNNRAIQVVYPESDEKKNKYRKLEGIGVVERDADDVVQVPNPPLVSWIPSLVTLPGSRFRVTKLPRQGAFDNMHIAPRMRVTAKFDRVITNGATPGNGGEAKFTSLKDWKMDEVVMAPFCAHDCFHLHWRWSNYAATLQQAWGFKDRAPSKTPGLPMVPPNHAVWLFVPSATQVSYLGRAEICTGEWECFCWHGGGYGLTGELGSKKNGFEIDRAIESVRFLTGTQFQNTFSGITDIHDWALFYWCNRYTLYLDDAGDAHVYERFKFIRRKRVLDL